MITSLPHRRAKALHRQSLYPIICAWCNRKERYGDSWGPCQEYPAGQELSHGICPECFASERAKIDRKHSKR